MFKKQGVFLKNIFLLKQSMLCSLYSILYSLYKNFFAATKVIRILRPNSSYSDALFRANVPI